jgi:hypothetical protein
MTVPAAPLSAVGLCGAAVLSRIQDNECRDSTTLRGYHARKHSYTTSDARRDAALLATRVLYARRRGLDYLALDVGSDKTDPPVVYLNHDDENVAIAANLVDFLRAWEGLYYLGPEHWLLLEFVGPDGIWTRTAIMRHDCVACSGDEQPCA